MVDLLEAVRHHCGDLEPALLERHFRRLPPIYFERYSAADIARHLRLLAGMEGEPPVDVEIRPLALHTFEVLVVGEDHAAPWLASRRPWRPWNSTWKTFR